MNRFTIAVILILCAASATHAQDGVDEQSARREQLGIRVGYAATTSDLDNNFGAGLNLDMHFMQEIRKPLWLDVTLGAFYMGATDRTDITFDVFQQSFDQASMRILRFTVAPTIVGRLDNATNVYVSGGAGIYVVSLLLDETFFQFDHVDNHLGLTAGGGITRQLSENWFLDFHMETHKFWTSTASDDMFYRYSEGDRNPFFYHAAVGLLLNLF